MMNIFKESLVYSFFISLVNIYQNGSIYAFSQKIKKAYAFSKTKRCWNSFAQKPIIYKGIYTRCLESINIYLIKFGVIYKHSLFKRLVFSVYKFFSFFFKESIFGKIGIRRLVLIMFCLYLPIDYVLRSVLKINLLAALWDEGLMFFAFYYILFRKATKPKRLASRATVLDGYLYLFIAVGFFLMCTVSPNISVAFNGYRAVVQYLFWFFVIINLLENDKDFMVFYSVLVFMAVLVGFHGIYQYIIKVPIPATWISQAEESVRTRVFSITGSPNILGSFLVLFAPMVAGLAYYFKNIWLKFTFVGITGVMCLSLIFTSSKGAWGGIFIAIVIFAIYLDRRLIALMLGSIAAALVFIPSITNRISFLFTADYVEASMRGGRMIRWETGKQLLSEVNQLFGFGLGRFGGAVAMQNKLIEETETFKYFYMDNYYLKTLVEMGYVGLFFYLLLLFGLIITCLRAIDKTRKTGVYALAVGMFSGMMGVLVHCYFENIFEVPYMMAYFWALAAGIIYLGYFRRKNN